MLSVSLLKNSTWNIDQCFFAQLKKTLFKNVKGKHFFNFSGNLLSLVLFPFYFPHPHAATPVSFYTMLFCIQYICWHAITKLNSEWKFNKSSIKFLHDSGEEVCMQPVRNMAAAFLQTWDTHCHADTEKTLTYKQFIITINNLFLMHLPAFTRQIDQLILYSSVLHSCTNSVRSCFYSVHAGLFHVSIIHWTLTWATQSLKCDCVLFTQGTSSKELL